LPPHQELGKERGHGASGRQKGSIAENKNVTFEFTEKENIKKSLFGTRQIR